MREHYYHHIHVLRKVISLLVVISLALFYYFNDRQQFLILISLLLSGFVVLDSLHHLFWNKNELVNFLFKIYPKKRAEYGQFLSDASIFFISTLLMTILFSKEVVFVALIMFIFIDASEQIFGNLFPSNSFLWNKNKGWKGTLIGFLLGVAVIFLFSLIFKFSINHSLIPAAIVGAIAGVSNKFDNVLIPWSIALIYAIN